MRARTLILLSAVVVLLAAASTLAIAVGRGTRDAGPEDRLSVGTTCPVPNLPGTAVNVTLTNMGGPMMGGSPVRGGMMRLSATTSSVTRGTISFVATNVGSVNHEFLVLPLPEGQIVGTRAIHDDGRIDELGSLGEASNTCGAGSGDGIAPGTSSWVTITLAPGRYELVCNLPGHYAAGMYTQLTVR
jgi:uncharacterized cupredoxin-like copper-binding protein